MFNPLFEKLYPNIPVKKENLAIANRIKKRIKRDLEAFSPYTRAQVFPSRHWVK